MIVAGIDVGQTGVRLRLGDRPAIELPSAGLGGGSIEAVMSAVEGLHRRADVDELSAGMCAIGMGLTGDYSRSEMRTLAKRVADLFGVPEVRVAHDSTSAFLGALGDSRGVVTMCGTGAVTLGHDGTSARRFDGYGGLGDWGGGRGLGLAGIRAGIRALDGVAGPTRLADQIRDQWSTPGQLFIRWRGGDPEAVSYVEGFARVVAECATERDAVAIELIREAARQAAMTTLAALDGLSLDTVSYGGAVLRNIPLFRREWIDTVESRGVGTVIVAPSGDGLDGAQRLAILAPAALRGWGAESSSSDRR